MNRLSTIGFVALLLVAAVASAQETISVVYDDGRTSEDISVWQTEEGSEELYLRANDVARIFKATQFWNASSRKVVLGIERRRFTLTIDTRVVVVDGEPVMLHNPIRYEEGFVLIPMEFVLEVASPYTPSVFEWSPASGTLRVERIGYNVQEIKFATTTNRSTATVSLGPRLPTEAPS